MTDTTRRPPGRLHGATFKSWRPVRNRRARSGVPSALRVTEQEAIARSRQGDEAAFAWIVRTYKHMVYTICHRVLRHREEAQEAAQDAFVKAFRHLPDFEDRSRFSTWLYSIAYRTAISALRSRPRATADLSEAGGLAGLVPAAGEAGDRARAVEIALAELPPEDAAVVSLYYLSEQSVEEIVTVTGLSASNVKVKLHRSRKRLLGTLQAHLKNEVWTLQGN